VITETWKDVPGWEGYYQASSEGRIRSVERKAISRSKSTRNAPATIRKQCTISNGYKQIVLHRDGIRTRFLVHRLILFTFCGLPADGLSQGHHKNGNKADNRIENLEWVTSSQNMRHAIDILKRQNLCGENNPSAKLSLEIVKGIRMDFSNGKSQGEIGRKYHIAQSHVSRIVRNIQWKQESK
jgi:hypothetical protein